MLYKIASQVFFQTRYLYQLQYFDGVWIYSTSCSCNAIVAITNYTQLLYHYIHVVDIAAFSCKFARGSHRETSLSTALVLLGRCSYRMQGCRALGRDYSHFIQYAECSAEMY